MKKTYHVLTLTALLAGSGLSAAKADHALVVGVNEYPKLGQGSNLEGCVNDAGNIAKSLAALGFEVTTLVNDQATKTGILEAIEKMKAVTRASERFVFYFAGHGVATNDGASSILPNDATEKTDASDLTRDELYAAVMNVPARSRTVLLDSCFSGGLGRRAIGRRVKKTRAYQRKKAEENGNPKHRALDNDSNDHIAGGAEIVYFTASLANQTSGEDDFDGVRGGVFTHFLTERLQKATKQTLWNEVQKDVTGEVADYMEQNQTPKLSPSDYASRPLFEAKTDPAPEPKPEPKPDPKPEPAPEPKPAPKPEPKRTVWDDFNEDHTDTAAFALKMTPEQATLKTKQPFTFEAKIGRQSGWLVLLEKDTDGKVYLLFPGNGDITAARVYAETTIHLPVTPGRSYAADASGTERVKALLFTDRDNAEALMKAFPTEGVEPRKMRRILEIDSPRQTFYTFGLTFSVE